MPGIYELILIFGIVALLFGTKKIKSVGSDIGSWIRDFRKAVKEDQDDNDYKNKSDRIIDIEDNSRKDKP
ncbi:MAG: twin-arginine translocase TatA/TatE family subunit [Pseudomonadota bacterium]|nr:twin-arginine translocase TatA/TatE family subunit [Pseudomonadota bacterium]